jgi:hypothetical protein
MRYVALFIAALLLPMAAEGQAVGLKQVAGPQITTTEIEGGTYIRAVRLARVSDTLWVWVQHVTPSTPPDTVSASHADLVVWCHPDLYPHPRHALPNAKGRVALLREGPILWVVEEGSDEWQRYVKYN